MSSVEKINHIKLAASTTSFLVMKCLFMRVGLLADSNIMQTGNTTEANQISIELTVL